MNEFKNFGIKAEVSTLQGEKIRINKVLNYPIIVEKYTISDSKYKEKTDKCLSLQILKDNKQHVIFTGSSVLISMITKVPLESFPFKTTIVQTNEYFEFT